MKIPLFLAMTAAEFQGAEILPEHPSWMACHFSPYGIGLSNVPESLPKGSMLMLNDRTPIYGHHPEVVARSLCEAAEKLGSESILLDFQRSGYEELISVIRAVLDRTNCPVGVSALYAREFDCPVLVPPIPPHIPPEEALTPWKGRELWLELSTEGTEIAVTEDGSRYTSLPNYIPEGTFHCEPKLHCHYQITAQEDRFLFHLGRTKEDQLSIQDATIPLGVTRALGIWQEMNGILT